MDKKAADAPPTQVRRRWPRRLMRYAIVLLVLYLGICLLFAALQNKLIFPGMMTQGTPESVVRPDSGTEIIRLTLPDNTPIVARFSPAVNVGSQNAPTVLFFYGNGMCMADTDAEISMLRRLGCNVIVPDYPGFGMSGGEPSESAIYATADAAYAHLQQRTDIDPKRIIAMGWSLGGAAAIDLASRKHVIGLITLSSFTSMPDMARNLFPYLPTSLMLKYRFDSLSKIPNVKVPTLIIHGQRDSIIPADMSRRLAGVSGGSSVKSIVIPGADHNDLFFVGQNEITAAIRQHLADIEGRK